MAVTDQAASRGQACPDPSAHANAHHNRLQDQAADAALYVTHPERRTNVRDMNPLGPDGKLSSAGAAASLKYARAQDLPSFPSVGIDTKNSGLTAASLAASNRKNIEWWTPTLSENASKAALLANDYKMKPLWQPEASAARTKAAKLAANGKGPDWWQPTPSKDGQQAAGLAFQKKNLSPQLDYGYTETGRNNSLLAARLSVKGRRRAGSTPERHVSQHYDDPVYQSNALRAATAAHEDGLQSAAMEQSRISHARNLSREMYTEHPPIGAGSKQERDHQDALKASAISMAKKMYAIERVDDNGNISLNAGRAARTADSQTNATGNPDIRKQAMQYIHLQEAAQKLAAEKLARIEDQQEAAAFRDYYGYGSPKRRSRLSIKGRNRRRASSESAATAPLSGARDGGRPSGRRNLDIDSDDEEQANKIRSQMSQFNSKVAEVDNKKRDSDRKILMAAAERKVQAQMSKMDEKVFNDTGKMSPAMIEDWDNKARAKAAAASQMRMRNHGRVDVGGGKFLDQSEIDAIAVKNVQPTLDQINETAQKQRARDEEIRLERSEQRRQATLEKERNTETKALQKKIKAEEKDAEKTKKREEKEAAKAEKQGVKQDSRLEKEAPKQDQDLYLYKKDIPEKEKRNRWSKLLYHDKKKEPGAISAGTAFGTTAIPKSRSEHSVQLTPTGQVVSKDVESEPEMTASGGLQETELVIPAQTATSKDIEDASAPPSPSKKRFSKILHKFKRSKKDKKESPERSFIGGTALTKRTNTDQSTSSAVAPRIATPSVSSLNSEEEFEERGRSAARLKPVGTTATDDGSESDGEDDFEEARDRFDDKLHPPPTFLSKKTESPVRDSKFHEAL